MSINKLNALTDQLKQLQDQQKRIDADIKELKKELMDEMSARQTDILQLKQYVLQLQKITRIIIDTERLRQDIPEVWDEYGKASSYQKLVIKEA